MKAKRFIWAWRPQVWLGMASLVLLVVALSNYSVGSAVASGARDLISPSRASNVKAPVIVVNPAGSVDSNPATAPKPMLALSFDDGPNPLTTPLILDALEKEHVHASFFVVGSRVKGSESILRREYRDGDDIGNHSWSHPDFIKLSRQQIAEQINKTQIAIAAAGVPAPFMFRPPYGDMGPNFPKHLPLAVVLWNIDPKDWDDHDAASLTQRIMQQARPGGIVDMHGIYLATAQAIVPAIAQLKMKYDLVTVSQLLGIKPGATGIYYGHR